MWEKRHWRMGLNGVKLLKWGFELSWRGKMILIQFNQRGCGISKFKIRKSAKSNWNTF